jgi:outer membrane protein assembly factor BamE
MYFLKHWTRLLRLVLFPALLLSCLGLAGCPFPPRIYRIDVQQGQYITPEIVCKIKRGMNKAEVINIMGTPTLCPINAQRLDYYYYLKPGDGGPIQQKYVSIFFVNNRVHEIQTAL